MGEIDRENIFWRDSLDAHTWTDTVMVTGYAGYRDGNKEYPLLIFVTMSLDDFNDIDTRKTLLWQDAIKQKQRFLERINNE